MYVYSFWPTLLLHSLQNLEAMELQIGKFDFPNPFEMKLVDPDRPEKKDLAGLKLLLTKEFENWRFREAKDADLALTNENTSHGKLVIFILGFLRKDYFEFFLWCIFLSTTTTRAGIVLSF